MRPRLSFCPQRARVHFAHPPAYNLRGIGTFEEILEVLTWRQLGLHDKPCAVLNVNGYFDQFLDFLDHAVAERFLQPEQRNRLSAEATPESILNSMDIQNISFNNN